MTSYCANGGICSQGASQDFATFELDAAIPRQGARQVDDMVAAGQGLGSKHMKYRRWMHGAKFWLGALLSVAYPALAVGIVIVDARDARDAQLRNLSQAQLTTVASGRAQRSAAPAPRRWRRSTACRATCRFPRCRPARPSRSSGPLARPRPCGSSIPPPPSAPSRCAAPRSWCPGVTPGGHAGHEEVGSSPPFLLQRP